MTKQALRLALLLAILGTVVVGVASVALAQPPAPSECRSPRYDLDRDGTIGRADLDSWKVVLEGSGCRFGSSAVGCPAVLDIDGSGTIDSGDVDALTAVMLRCAGPSAGVSPGS